MRRDLRGQSLGMCIFGRSTESSVNYPSIFLSLHMCIYIYASIYLSIYLFIYLSIYQSIYLSILLISCFSVYIYYFISSSLFLHRIYIYIHIYIFTYIYISIRKTVYVSVCSAYQFVYYLSVRIWTDVSIYILYWGGYNNTYKYNEVTLYINVLYILLI